MSRGLAPVCGIDEAGRGPWAGPVVAAAVILDPAPHSPRPRRFQEAHRSAARGALRADPGQRAVGVGIAEVTSIDRDNILQATFWAMARGAARSCRRRRACALVDGNRAPALPCPCETIVERRCRLALDRRRLDHRQGHARPHDDGAATRPIPHYGLARHKGYGTALHHVGAASVTDPARSTAGASRPSRCACWRVNHFPGIRFTP